MRQRSVAIPLIAGVLCAVDIAGPASAAGSGTTDITFTENVRSTAVAVIGIGDPLSITVPAAASLGSAAPGGTITAKIGAVQVTQSGLITAGWTASVSSTNFTTGTGTPAQTIPNSAVSYWSGIATATTGLSLGSFTPGQATAANAQSLGTSRTAYSLSGASLVANSATWNPTLVVHLPAGALAGTYTGTLTHSVS
jgi:hypothetical protein